MTYIIIDDGTDSYMIDKDGNELSIDYWLFYSPMQKKKNKQVMKQMLTIWSELEETLTTLYRYDIDLNDIMLKVHKLFFNYMRMNKQYENNIKQRKQIKDKINKLKQKIFPI